jgi:hypothetical protein
MTLLMLQVRFGEADPSMREAMLQKCQAPGQELSMWLAEMKLSYASLKHMPGMEEIEAVEVFWTGMRDTELAALGRDRLNRRPVHEHTLANARQEVFAAQQVREKQRVVHERQRVAASVAPRLAPADGPGAVTTQAPGRKTYPAASVAAAGEAPGGSEQSRRMDQLESALQRQSSLMDRLVALAVQPKLQGRQQWAAASTAPAQAQRYGQPPPTTQGRPPAGLDTACRICKYDKGHKDGLCFFANPDKARQRDGSRWYPPKNTASELMQVWTRACRQAHMDPARPNAAGPPMGPRAAASASAWSGMPGHPGTRYGEPHYAPSAPQQEHYYAAPSAPYAGPQPPGGPGRGAPAPYYYPAGMVALPAAGVLSVGMPADQVLVPGSLTPSVGDARHPHWAAPVGTRSQAARQPAPRSYLQAAPPGRSILKPANKQNVTEGEADADPPRALPQVRPAQQLMISVELPYPECKHLLDMRHQHVNARHLSFLPTTPEELARSEQPSVAGMVSHTAALGDDGTPAGLHGSEHLPAGGASWYAEYVSAEPVQNKFRNLHATEGCTVEIPATRGGEPSRSVLGANVMTDDGAVVNLITVGYCEAIGLSWQARSDLAIIGASGDTAGGLGKTSSFVVVLGKNTAHETRITCTAIVMPNAASAVYDLLLSKTFMRPIGAFVDELRGFVYRPRLHAGDAATQHVLPMITCVPRPAGGAAACTAVPVVLCAMHPTSEGGQAPGSQHEQPGVPVAAPATEPGAPQATPGAPHAGPAYKAPPAAEMQAREPLLLRIFKYEGGIWTPVRLPLTQSNPVNASPTTAHLQALEPPQHTHRASGSSSVHAAWG